MDIVLLKAKILIFLEIMIREKNKEYSQCLRITKRTKRLLIKASLEVINKILIPSASLKDFDVISVVGFNF